MNMGRTKIKILTLIAESPTYGYEISNKTGVPLSSVYGHLKYFTEKNLIKSYDGEGKRQIYYKITENGKKLLEVIKEA